MNPQQFQQNPNTFYQQPTYAPVPVKSKVNKMLIILSAILFIAGASVSTYFMGNLSKKDSEIKEIQKQLSEAKAKLTETESQLASLGERKTGVEALQASNDETRKSDIAQFIAEVNMYVAENQGTFPSTEPSVFKDEFETPYLTNDLME
ncbi:MAG TPA: hypothetical protein PKD20_04215, partial [Candidatus Saccharibacteria bacterium]|nr:hypothetical protein [Candidatus Saccharibacteria bacterium]